VTIGNSVTSIGSAEFLNCESLVSVTIPNSVISIGADAFHSCAKMVSVTLGSGVTIIEGNAFIYCTRLTSITFLGLAAPTSVGANWITGTNGGIRGHAPIGGVGYANPFYGLTMV